MKIILFMSAMIMAISIMMILINQLISKKSFSDREKMSPFECGFDPKSSPRIPFSLQFFLIMMIFIVFDVEIALILPIVNTTYITEPISFFVSFSFFIMILLGGTIHEWKQGSLNWKY